MSDPSPILGYANTAAVAQDDGTLVLHPPPLAWRLAILAMEMIVTLGGTWVMVVLAGYYLSTPATRDRNLVAGVTSALVAAVCVGWFIRCLIVVVRVQRLGRTPCTLRVDGESLIVDWPMQWGPTPRVFPRASIHSYLLGGLGIRKLFLFSKTTTLLTVPFVPLGDGLDRVRSRLREMLGPELD